MNDLDDKLRGLMSSAGQFMKRFIMKKLVSSPPFWGALALILLLFVTFSILFAFVGDVTTDSTIQANGMIASSIVNSIPIKIESYNERELDFKLPYGIPYSIQLYARDWDDKLDTNMVKQIAEDLKPEFEYFDYLEPTEVWESWYDAKGNYFSNHYITYNKRRFIKSINTYAGIFYPIYDIWESRDVVDLPEFQGKLKYHKLTVVRPLIESNLDFLTDWTRLDTAIMQYASTNNPKESTIEVATYEAEPGQMLYPFAGSYPVTSPFGWRIHPIHGDKRFHTGVDFGTPMGTPIIAVLDGVVTLAGPGGGYGNVVFIKHANGLSTVYAHLSTISVKQGDFVKRGQVIALSGNTGASTGPHLHFEVRVNGTPVNPLPYLGGNVEYAGGTINYVPLEDRMLVMETAFAVMGQSERFKMLTSDEEPDIKNPSPPIQEKIESTIIFPEADLLKKITDACNEAGRDYGINPSVLMAIAYIESNFNPTAVGVDFREANTALLGMTQLSSSVLSQYGVLGTKENHSSSVNSATPSINAFDIRASAFTTAKYLRSLMNHYEAKGYNEKEALRIALWRYNDYYSWWFADKVLSTAEKAVGSVDNLNKN